MLGQVQESFEEFIPQPGPGLAGVLAALQDNFNVLRNQLGFNNDAAELNRTFSLRWENYRIGNTPESDEAWRNILRDAWEPDLNAIPEYRTFALPLPITGPLPGFVFNLSTAITTGKNFFGWPSTGDELYPTTYFAVKLHRVGLRFSDYPGSPLNNQVECYLIPAGADVMRVPSCLNPKIRYWNLLDQTLPVPNILVEGDFADPDWMPWDSLIGGPQAMVDRRRYPTIPALPDTAKEDEDLSFILTGRIAWNTQWTLMIPAISLQGSDPDQGIDVFIGCGDQDCGSDIMGCRNGNCGRGISDIQLLFNSYGYFGCTSERDLDAPPAPTVEIVYPK